MGEAAAQIELEGWTIIEDKMADQEQSGESNEPNADNSETTNRTEHSVYDQIYPLLERFEKIRTTIVIQIKGLRLPQSQYVHKANEEAHKRLYLVVAIMFACILGIGIGHLLGFINATTDQTSGWSGQRFWEQRLTAAQVASSLKQDNEIIQSHIKRLRHIKMEPINIAGKEGKEGRLLREQISNSIVENEELRLKTEQLYYSTLANRDEATFGALLKQNLNLRISLQKILHLGANLDKLKESVESLKEDNEEIRLSATALRFQQPFPRELGSMVRELEGVKQVVNDAIENMDTSPKVSNAKTYLSFMSQILTSLQDLSGISIQQRLSSAADIFTQIIPSNYKLPTQMQYKLKSGQDTFLSIRTSLAKKWKKIRMLGRPECIAAVGHATLNRMTRVILNVVNKLKQIGLNVFITRGPTPADQTMSLLTDQLDALNEQLESTWLFLEDEVVLSQSERNDIINKYLTDDSDSLLDTIKTPGAIDVVKSHADVPSEIEEMKMKLDKKRKESKSSQEPLAPSPPTISPKKKPGKAEDSIPSKPSQVEKKKEPSKPVTKPTLDKTKPKITKPEVPAPVKPKATIEPTKSQTVKTEPKVKVPVPENVRSKSGAASKPAEPLVAEDNLPANRKPTTIPKKVQKTAPDSQKAKPKTSEPILPRKGNERKPPPAKSDDPLFFKGQYNRLDKLSDPDEDGKMSHSEEEDEQEPSNVAGVRKPWDQRAKKKSATESTADEKLFIRRK